MSPKKEKKAAVVYHRIDFDGICSYAVARQTLEMSGFEVSPFPFTHGDPEPDIPDLLQHDIVVIVDICLSTESMLCLRKNNGTFLEGKKTVIWIDHHKTSIETSIEKGFDDMPGLREIGKGACELTWNFCHTEAAKLPQTVAWLSAYDVYDKRRFDWNEDVLPFQYGMRNMFNLNAEKFFDAFEELCSEGEEKKALVEKVISEGRAILSYARQTGSFGVNAYGFEVTIGGKEKAVCCLTNNFGSLAFEEKMKETGIRIAICVNRINGERYKVSMFGDSEENRFDLGNYCKSKYSGGGHFNAAGGVLNRVQFIRLVTKCQI